MSNSSLGYSEDTSEKATAKYCTACGAKLVDGARFCQECGTAVSFSNNSSTKRESVYEGSIHKCPNCGEVIKAFEISCPACGFEFRNSKVSNSVSEFASRLEHVQSEDQQVTLIRNFIIPNTKEDIMEFMILASSNIKSGQSKKVFDAWQTKFEQSYQKAKLLLKDDSRISEIQSIYDETRKRTYLIEAGRNAKSVGSAVGKGGKSAGHFIANNASSLPNIILCAAWVISIFVLIPLCRGLYSRDYSDILTLVLIGGAIIVPFVTRCSSWIPKLIIVLGLVLSIAALLPRCQGIYGSNYQDILTIEIICAIIIVVRMFKKPNNPKEQKED